MALSDMVSARDIAEAVFIGLVCLCGAWLLDSYLGEAGIQLKRGTSSRGEL